MRHMTYGISQQAFVSPPASPQSHGADQVGKDVRVTNCCTVCQASGRHNKKLKSMSAMQRPDPARPGQAGLDQAK